ncbi:MAG: acyl-CoA dehydrogenase, partial [Proteobacteria bacterium]
EMVFENLEVDFSCILGAVGQGWVQASNNLMWERMMLTLLSIGGARACYQDALRYSEERSAFGRRIGEFGTIANMLEEMRAKLLLGEAIAHHCIELIEANKPCRAEVAAAKRQVCEDCIWIADRAIQIHGGYGYTTEFSAERWWRDLRLMTIGGGTSEIMGNVLVKELGL